MVGLTPIGDLLTPGLSASLLAMVAGVQDRQMADGGATVTITRSAGGPPVLDRDTMTYTDPREHVWTGQCRVIRDAGSSVAGIPGDEVTLDTATVVLPPDVTGVKVDDRVTVDASLIPGQVGEALRVTTVQYGSDTAAVVLSCVADQG